MAAYALCNATWGPSYIGPNIVGKKSSVFFVFILGPTSKYLFTMVPRNSRMSRHFFRVREFPILNVIDVLLR